MIQVFKNVNIDWLANRRIFIGISIVTDAGWTGYRPSRAKVTGRHEAFNLGVDFKGGTVVTARFKQPTTAEDIRGTLGTAGIGDAIIQPVTDKPNTFLIKLPLEGGEREHRRSNSNKAGAEYATALNNFGAKETRWEILGTDAVGAVAGAQLRNKAIAVTLAALVGMLVYIAFRFEWTYGAAAVIAVFHDVLVTLGFFSIFQWEISLTVIAALLTLVGFSVNDTIVVFDRIT